MERKALEELIKWKDDKYRKPLMVWGGRQTGKTYLIRDIFARRYFPDNYIYVDFKVEDEIRDFCNSTASAAKIIEFISLFKEKRIDKNTLLIFDEIQECLNAVSSLKYFCQDYPEIPVIATGSMVRIRIQRYRNSRGPKNEGGFLFQLVKNYYGNKILKYCTDKFACSDQAAAWLFKNHTSDAVIVKNGIDLTHYSGQDHRDPNSFTICAIGRFVPVKNHDFLIDVFAELHRMDSSSRLVLAGSGVLMDTIQQKVNDLHLTDYVTFLGDCNDIPHLLEKVDVLCMPSLFEGLGIVTIEAQAAGVPCVVSNTIPPEINITDSVSFLSLHDSPVIWAHELLSHKGKTKPDNRALVTSHGYNITSTISQLQQFYLTHQV